MEKLIKNSNGQWILEESLIKTSKITKQAKSPLRTDETVNTQAHQIVSPNLDPNLGSRPESRVKLISEQDKQKRSKESYSSRMGYGDSESKGRFIPDTKGQKFGVDSEGKQVSLSTGWATTPSTQFHEGFHGLVDKISQDHKKGGFDRPHRAAGVFLSILNDRIHPGLNALLHNNLKSRKYDEDAKKTPSKEKQIVHMLSEKVALVQDLMNSPDRRRAFFDNASKNGLLPPKGTKDHIKAKRDFFNKLKSSMKGMQEFSKKASWEDLKAYKPHYEFTLTNHNILED